MGIEASTMNDDEKRQRKIRLNAILLGLVAIGFFATFLVLVALRG